MAENLSYGAEGSKCYDKKLKNCKKYGRLYDWETAIKACPAGWHLPSNDEWDRPFLNVGDFGSWWCGSEDGTYFAYGRVMGYCYEQANWFYYNESNLYSVRCVQNPSEAEIYDDMEDISDLLLYDPNRVH
jgi:hypothetical protein